VHARALLLWGCCGLQRTGVWSLQAPAGKHCCRLRNACRPQLPVAVLQPLLVCCLFAVSAVCVTQEVKRFGGPMMISCTPVFGGAGVANQISELKRGTEVRQAVQSMAAGLCVRVHTHAHCRVVYVKLGWTRRMFSAAEMLSSCRAGGTS
jgi:hypothetical protein